MVNAVGINDKYNCVGYSGISNVRKIDEQSIFLEEKLENIEDKQGILGKAWNGIKEFTSLGVSQSDCENMLEKYNKGEISFEEAVNYLDEYDSKQETMSGLFENILTGVGGIALATATAGTGNAIGWGLAFLKGAPVGAVIKTGLGALDRATNDIEGDALDGKQIAKDAISGALTGAASAVSGSECLIYKSVGKNITTNKIGNSIIKGALCGVECGAMSGVATYMTDVALGDKKFNFGDLTSDTLTSVFVSGSVGGALGGVTANLGGSSSVAKDCLLSSTRKALGVGEKEVLDI